MALSISNKNSLMLWNWCRWGRILRWKQNIRMHKTVSKSWRNPIERSKKTRSRQPLTSKKLFRKPKNRGVFTRRFRHKFKKLRDKSRNSQLVLINCRSLKTKSRQRPSFAMTSSANSHLRLSLVPYSETQKLWINSLIASSWYQNIFRRLLP